MSVAASGPARVTCAASPGSIRAVEDHRRCMRSGPSTSICAQANSSPSWPLRLREIHSSGCPRGARPATAGSVVFEGRRGGRRGPEGVGVVFQEDASFPWLTVWDNAAFALRRAAVSDRVHERVDHALSFMGLAGFASAYPGAALRRHAPAPLHRAHARYAPAPAPAR